MNSDLRDQVAAADSARDRLAFALDGADLDGARAWVSTLAPHVGVFKVGLELFISAGPAAISIIHEAGCACFLDLKLHDIPATMRQAASRAAALGVRYLTVHTSAGSKALAGVVDATRGSGTEVLGVTVLTSTADEDLAELGLGGTAATQVMRLASLATSAGLAGLVCSPMEVAALRRVHPEARLVSPGIRSASEAKGDQVRTASAYDAIRAGTDVIVVGRPIREAADPVLAAQELVRDIARAIEDRGVV